MYSQNGILHIGRHLAAFVRSNLHAGACCTDHQNRTFRGKTVDCVVTSLFAFLRCVGQGRPKAPPATQNASRKSLEQKTKRGSKI